MSRKMKPHRKGARSRQCESLALRRKQLDELETATNQLYEAVEKGLLPMDQTLAEQVRVAIMG